MNQVVPILADRVPALIAAGGEKTTYRFFEFFTANIRNPHTRRAYARAAVKFLAWLALHDVTQLAAIESAGATASERPTAKTRYICLSFEMCRTLTRPITTC